MEVMDISGLFEFFKGLWHDAAAVFFLGVVQEVDASQGELEAGVVRPQMPRVYYCPGATT